MNSTQQKQAWKKTVAGNWMTVVDGVEMFAVKSQKRGWDGWAKVAGELFTTNADYRRQIPEYLQIEMREVN